MPRHDGSDYAFAPEPIREEDRALHKWPPGYWQKCDEMLAQLQKRYPTAYVSMVVRQDGRFHVRVYQAGQTLSLPQGADRLEALQNALGMA